MSDHHFKQRDFEHPSRLFVLEDTLKGLIGANSLYKSYFETFGLRGNERVLDFGCGGGIGSRYLANLLPEGHLTCVDTSSYWMKKARKRLSGYANVECKLGDIRELDIPEASLDAISIFRVIHDIPPAERQGIINALSGKLKVSGRLFIRERIGEHHGMPVAEIRKLLSNANFEETEQREIKAEYIGRYLKNR